VNLPSKYVPLVALALAACQSEPAGGPVEVQAAELVLSNHLSAMYAAGPDAAARYQASLERVRANGRTVLELATTMYRRTPLADHDRRWSLIQLAGETRAPRAHELLVDAAVAPLPTPPPPAAPTPGEDSPPSTVENEMVVRQAALRSLAALAPGNPAARAALEEVVRRAPARIRREAAIKLVILEGHSDAVVARLRSLLPADEHWVLSVKKKEKPQPMPMPEGMSP
jgi:hypothetical protein